MSWSADSLPALQGEQLHLWHCDLDTPVAPPLLAQYRSLLDETETRRLHRLLGARQRERFLISHAFTRAVLSLYIPPDSGGWEFAHGADGKPYVHGLIAAHTPGFNLSHSANCALLAVVANGAEVGVDIEFQRPERRFQALARRHFAPAERAALDELSAQLLARRFYRFWSLKEAYIKARGQGLRLPLDQFWFEADDATGALRFDATPMLDAHPARWSFFGYELAAGFSAAVAIQREAQPLPRFFETVPLQHWRERTLAPLFRTRRITGI